MNRQFGFVSRAGRGPLTRCENQGETLSVRFYQHVFERPTSFLLSKKPTPVCFILFYFIFYKERWSERALLMGTAGPGASGAVVGMGFLTKVRKVLPSAVRPPTRTQGPRYFTSLKFTLALCSFSAPIVFKFWFC